MRILLISATVLFSSAAFGQFGQSVQLQLQSVSGTDTLSVGPTQCGERLPFNWRVTGSLCADVSLWITRDTDCKETASAQTAGSTRELASVSRDTVVRQSGTGTANFEVSSLPLFSSTDGGVGCGASDLTETMRLCGSTKQADYLGQCNTAVKASAALKIAYDTQAPGVPTFQAVDGLDRALRVRVGAPADATEVRLVVLRDGNEVKQQRAGVGAGPFEVENLVNGVTYQLQAYAIDAVGNESSEFASAEGTPTYTRGFAEVYREAGGKETGGCGAAGGGVAGGAVLTVLGFWLFSRRNRSWLEQ